MTEDVVTTAEERLKWRKTGATYRSLARCVPDLLAAVKGARHTVSELQGFLDDAKAQKAELQDILKAIMQIHAPYTDVTSLTLPSMSSTAPPGRITLRCRVCKTEEHHTWGPDNDEIWPCPTARTFVHVMTGAPEVATPADDSKEDAHA